MVYLKKMIYLPKDHVSKEDGESNKNAVSSNDSAWIKNLYQIKMVY